MQTESWLSFKTKKNNEMKKIIYALIIVLSGFTAEAQYTRIYDFAGTNGWGPNYTTPVTDGTYLYGVTRVGGTYGYGVIFKVKPDATGFVKLFDFDLGPTGGEPNGSLVTDGTYLYGMTNGGGVNYDGVIFKIKKDGTGYLKLFNFSEPTTGYNPMGSLILIGTTLYGMALEGGTNSNGVIFKISTTGTGYTKIHEFAGTDGGQPIGSLYYDGTYLYGMTRDGGTSSQGVVFKVKPDGTGYVVLHTFTGTDGSHPTGSVILTGGFLYGMTEFGGTNSFGDGVIFKVKTDGTGFAKIVDFDWDNGSQPESDLIFDGSYLYGMTQFGGMSCGVFFRAKTDGTEYSKLFDFSDDPYGCSPHGSLLYDGLVVYGMTSGGGASSGGTVFKFEIPVGIEEYEMEKSFSVFPNPAHGILKINSLNGLAGRLIISNLLGENVFESEVVAGLNQIDVSGFPSGMYSVKVITRKGTYVSKIAIQ
jgi:uncharacterized repeat protein (TIGR03803 family)